LRVFFMVGGLRMCPALAGIEELQETRCLLKRVTARGGDLVGVVLKSFCKSSRGHLPRLLTL
jgi:hypothetical protein